ncbi:uncharacterized protein LOC135482798 [Lineus longissimus]|uniref:uncharacterized protein LOC135482798 n=1 Tax=Lineus longissimus TaxID=88925 RepID=UPI002B4DE0C2
MMALINLVLSCLLYVTFCPVHSQLTSCKDAYVQGTEPKLLEDLYGGHLVVLLADVYTFQKEGDIVGWQLYNACNCSSYYVDVFRPVPVFDNSNTFDLVHSTEVAAPCAGQMNIVESTPFKVLPGDHIGFHSVGKDDYGLSHSKESNENQWPVLAEGKYSSDITGSNNRVVFDASTQGRQVAVRAILITKDADAEESCHLSFLQRESSTITSAPFQTNPCYSELECARSCTHSLACTAFQFDSDKKTCDMYLPEFTAVTQQNVTQTLSVFTAN